ncbi:decarboxylating NADP(+)-dependent phosphogluconate dehydrogenase [Gemmata sp. G18]|uniref:6-phosphogluconate dehydrogenase, decarboxylating n=1 Tax=Gemmata palustris TaxID=2822762 RepID=A0ABS5BZX8_9BACT|nr:decarboxylating NADP(+)-dependent phosphogluconate dehydrogenase [Gemmata palustris]MBP3958947.1 decarboxylating NADP(+)-dependent phosphogluconate dehydrogenase [Gemmata palustris]
MAAPTADIGLVGLAVMGENLVLNMESRGYTVAVYNRSTDKVEKFVTGRGKGKKFVGAMSPQEFVASIKRPRKVVMLVKAGKAVDDTIAMIAPFLESGDILIDGGNTHFPDTTRRAKELEPKGILYVGSGVSGGEEGALKGPSIMPGGNAAAWPAIKPIFQSIAAKVKDANGTEAPCCDWVGPEGAGHFVKMVHNGIEYGDMQLICESYNLLKDMCGLTPAELSGVFGKWNKGVLDSYLIEITTEILAYTDPETKKPLVDLILDTAGQKGTGKWTIDAATDNGVALTLIAEAVFSRCISAQKDERVAASKVLAGPEVQKVSDRDQFIADVEMALYAAKIVSYAQGYALMAAQAKANGWELNNGGIALMWRGGCIIRSAFLGKIKEAFDQNPKLVNLLVDPFFAGELGKAQSGWRRVVGAAAASGIPVPAISSALSYYDGYRTARLPANLLQAQRDYFGAHTYERLDKPRGQFFHTNWTGRGGDTASTTYNV